jgi:hypothetical protein
LSRVDTSDVRDDAHLIARLRFEFEGEIEYVGRGEQRDLIQPTYAPPKPVVQDVDKPAARRYSVVDYLEDPSALDVARVILDGYSVARITEWFKHTNRPMSVGCSCADNPVCRSVIDRWNYVQWSWARCEEQEGHRCSSAMREMLNSMDRGRSWTRRTEAESLARCGVAASTTSTRGAGGQTKTGTVFRS